VCVFCPLKETKVLNFTEETLNKCEYVLECRKTHKLIGKDVNLPNDWKIERVGYHIRRYRNFTALKSKYRKKEETDNLNPAIPSTSTGR